MPTYRAMPASKVLGEPLVVVEVVVSLEEIPQFGFTLSEVTRDLHADGPVGVMTDYERKFYGEGKSINRCVATMVEWTEPEIEDVPSPAE